MMFSTWKERTFVGFASAFESYNIVVYAALQTYLHRLFFPESAFGVYASLLTWLPFILRFLVGPAGCVVIGYYAERHGRKAALALSSWITGVATLMMACLPGFDIIGYWAPCLLFVMQILQSFSYGGEFPTTTVYLMENSKPHERYRSSAVLVAFNLLVVCATWFITGICEYVFTEAQMAAYGWRIPLLIGALNIYIGHVIRCKVKESSTFQTSTTHKINPVIVLQLLCIFAPNTILFFTNTIATKTLVEQLTTDPILLSSLPILMTLLSCLTCLLAGWWMDKTDQRHSLLRRTYIWMIFLAAPVYGLQALDSLFAVVLSVLLIALTVGISMAATLPEMYQYLGERNKVIVIGLAFSIGGMLFGSTAPLLVSILAGYGQAYVGLMMSCGGVLYFMTDYIGKRRLQTALYQ